MSVERNASTLQILKEARSLIKKGWVQCAFYQNGRYCALGALHAAHGKDAAYRAFKWAIGSDEICVWNDAPDRTRPQVLAAFDRAIAMLEKEEV